MNCIPIINRNLAADYPLYYQSWFYLTSSHYLSHKMYYYSYLVMIALGLSRNLMVYCRKFISTYWLHEKSLLFLLYQLSQSVLSFTTPTTVLRRFLLQSPVRTFIILTMVKSPCFGSNFKHFFVILTFGLTTRMLAFNVNLVTPYAEGTF